MLPPDQTTRFANRPAPICHPEADQSVPSRLLTKLLISVRNTEEAAIVCQAGVDWIDLKEPKAGSLGQPSLSDAIAVAELLSDHPQRSAALGELSDLDEESALEFAPLFPVLKVGLSRIVGSVADDNARWQSRFQSLSSRIRKLGSELIPVAYADWTTCGAPSLQEILTLAQQVRPSYLLIDTFTKDGRGLLDCLSLEELNLAIQSAREFDCGIVLAGSLKIADVPELLNLYPAALAVRGAVCHSDLQSTQPHSIQDFQPRTTPIDPLKVDLWRRSV